jgi:hypothetical protein
MDLSSLIWLSDGSYNIAGIVLCAVAVWFVVDKLLRFDTRVEGRRRNAQDASEWCGTMGFVLMADIFKDYSVGDYNGMWDAVRTFLKTMATPATRLGIVRNVVHAQLKEYQTNEEHRKVIDEVFADQGFAIKAVPAPDAKAVQSAG